MNTPNRRQFCETLALAVALYAAGKRPLEAAPAQTGTPARGFRIVGINHISYACPDYRKARDFYASVLGMENLPSADNGRETRLMFGPPPGKGGSFLIPRNGRTAANAKATVDHICYAISNWDEKTVRSALKARGLEEPPEAGGLHVYDPFDYDVQLTGGPASSDAGGAAAAPALKIANVDHVSYTCPDFRRAADWYSKIFNLEQTDASATEVTLPFGKKDQGLPHLIIRARETTPGTRRKSKALVNHIAYTIADFDKDRVRAELKRLGYPQPLQDGEHSFHIVDPNGFDVQISGIQMTALGG
jgi:catechol 2,3-dioxygenase-like lactoylglutathione lyase family enzyme